MFKKAGELRTIQEPLAIATVDRETCDLGPSYNLVLLMITSRLIKWSRDGMFKNVRILLGLDALKS